MIDDDCARAQLDRRGFLKTVGASVGAAGAVGMGATWDDGPVGDAEAVAPIVGISAAAGVGYLVYKAAEPYLGNSQDHSNYTGADALHSAIYEDSKEMVSADSRVMTSIENNVTHSRNVALPKGKAAAIEAMNKGKSESQAITDMQDAVDGYFSTIQQNILTHWNSQQEQAHSMVLDVENHETLTLSDAFVMDGTSNSWGSSNEVRSDDIELVDGSMAEMKTHTVTDGNGTTRANALFRPVINSGNWFLLKTKSPSNSDTQTFVYTGNFANNDNTPTEYSSDDDDTWSEVLRNRDSVIDNLSGFVSDVYKYYDKGEIPTDKLLDPVTATTELQQNYDGYQTAGAHAAMLGIPSQTARSLYLELHDAGLRVYADIYTEHVPTDSNGNEIGFKQGVRYSPSEWSEPIYLAFEVGEERTATTTDTTTTSETETTTDTATTSGTATTTDTATTSGTATDSTQWTSDSGNVGTTDFTQIEQDFTVVHAENKNGEEIDTFQTESDNTQTADISKVEEELAQIRAIQRQMQESSQSGGGGGALFGGNIGPGAAIAAVAGIAGLGFLANQDNGSK